MSFENTQAYWLNLFWAREYGDGCFYYYSLKKKVVIAFGTLSSFLT